MNTPTVSATASATAGSPISNATGVPSPELGEHLESIRREEQERIDRQRQEELARLRELARYD